MIPLLLALLATLPPAPQGKCVLDAAGVFSSAQFNALESRCEAIDRSGAGQIAIVTTKDLQGRTRPEYASELFRAWGVGHKGKQDGILLLLALPPADRGIKVEIGYGLEGVLPDGKAMGIVRSVGLPALKEGKYAQGLLNIVDAYTPLMQQEAANQVMAVKTPDPTPAPKNVQATHKSLGLFVFLLVILPGGLLFAVFFLLWRRSKRKEEEAARKREQVEREWKAKASLPLTPSEREDYVPSTPPARETYVPPTPVREEHTTNVFAPVVIDAPVEHHHHRSHHDDDDSSSSSWGSSSSSSSSSDDSSSGGGFGGFDGGSSGGGGGDAGF